MTNKAHTYVLGTGLSHDGSACLLKDGRICVAIEKERITRRKHDGGNDTEAINYCLDAEGITLRDVALVVQNANFGMLNHGNNWWAGPRLFNDAVPVVTITHHLAHAYSAIGTSPFDEAAVIIIDGCGSSLDDCLDADDDAIIEQLPADLRHLYYEKDSYYIFKDNTLTPLVKDFSPWGAGLKNHPMYPNTTLHSIGGLYLAASMYVFNGFEDPGKLMGLAPYGRPGKYDFKIFDLRDDRVFVNYDWQGRFNKPSNSYQQLKANFQYYADLAYWVQREVERAILYLLDARYRRAPSDNLAYAGGVALNAVANRRILTESKFRNVYIQPAAGDNGLAIGCAYYGWMEVLKKERVKHNGSMYLGKSYQRHALTDTLASYKDSIEFSEADDYITKTAALLAEGKVVGWFQGGAEFGPRALGHRSILADPRKVEMRDFINSKIKFREDFRPFAPSVLAEDAGVYFDCDYESPYMLLVAPVRPQWRSLIPSVTHHDQSARIQTVTENVSPGYYRLLRAFKEITGISVLLNTSFNRRGMPIVETPEQAIDFFLACDLDVLVLDNYIVQKQQRAAIEPLDPVSVFVGDISNALERNMSDARRMGGSYQINISGTRTLVIDLSKDKPVVLEGRQSQKVDARIEIVESDLRALRADPENEGVKLFMSGKIKVTGDPNYAMNIVRLLRYK